MNDEHAIQIDEGTHIHFDDSCNGGRLWLTVKSGEQDAQTRNLSRIEVCNLKNYLARMLAKYIE